jgi:hypothetical protein
MEKDITGLTNSEEEVMDLPEVFTFLVENKEVNFERKNLMSGIYIVKLTTQNGQSYDKRIIVK